MEPTSSMNCSTSRTCRSLSRVSPTQRLHGSIPLGPDLLLRLGHDLARLVLGLGQQVLAHLLGGLAGLVDDLAGLGARVAELLLVLGQHLVRVALGLLGLLQAALDLRPALVEELPEARQHPLRHEEEQDTERDRPDDQLVQVRIQVLGVVRRLLRSVLLRNDQRGDERDHGRQLLR
jgi:hypothetical protein